MNPPPLLDPHYLNQDKKLRAPRATAVPKEQLLSSLQLSPKWIAGKKKCLQRQNTDSLGKFFLRRGEYYWGNVTHVLPQVHRAPIFMLTSAD